MCELATLSLAATAIGAAMSAYGQIQQGKAQSAASKYQAAVARNNSIIAEQNAQAERERGLAQEQAQRMKTAGLIASQRAAFAGSGVDIDSGSALLVQESSSSLGELDALTIRNNAERNAHGYRTQGMNFQAQSVLNSAQADWARQTGTMGGFSSILGGASQVGNQWATYKHYGVL